MRERKEGEKRGSEKRERKEGEKRGGERIGGSKQEWWADNDNEDKEEKEQEQEENEENKGEKIVLFFTLRFFRLHFFIEFLTTKIALDRTRLKKWQSDKQ